MWKFTATSVYTNPLLTTIDFLISFLLVGMLVVGYWRGTWNLLSYYIYPEHPDWMGCVCLTLGLIGLTLMGFSQRLLRRKLTLDNKLAWILGYHSYTYIAGLISVSTWMGLWTLLDFYTGTSLTSGLVCSSLAFVAMALLRCSKSLCSAPIAIAMDTHQDFFSYPTRFQTKPSFASCDSTERYIMHTLFTTTVISCLVAIYWRGGFTVLNQLADPYNPAIAAYVVLSISGGLFFLCLPLQFAFKTLFTNFKQREYPKITRVIIEEVLFAAAAVANVLFWWAIWNILDLYIIPDDLITSSWVTHGVGIGGLMLLCCGNSVVVKGCFLSGEEEPPAMLPNHYIRHFLFKYSTAKESAVNGKLSQGHLNNGINSNVVKLENDVLSFSEINKSQITTISVHL